MPFEFITHTHPDESRHEASRQQVRSHVMRQYHRHQTGVVSARAPRGKRQPKDLGKYVGAFRGVQVQLQDGARNEVRKRSIGGHDSVSRRERQEQEDRYLDLLGGSGVVERRSNVGGLRVVSSRVDPFGCLPVMLNREEDFLLNRYIALLIPTRAPLGFKAQWLMQSIHCDVLLHGLLIVSAGYYALIQNSSESRATILRRSNVIHYVSGQLDDPVQAVRDDVIGVVACLAFAEFLLDRRKQLEMHTRGLKKMVDMRGGLDNLGIKGLLRTFILLVDLCTSTVPGLHASFEESQLPPEDYSHVPNPHPAALFENSIPQLLDQNQNQSPSSSSKPPDPHTILSQALALLYSTKHYQSLLEFASHADSSPSHHFISGARLYNLEHPALALCTLLSETYFAPRSSSSFSSSSPSPSNSDSNSGDGDTDSNHTTELFPATQHQLLSPELRSNLTLAHAALTTLLIYIHGHIRGFPPHAPIIKRWLSQLLGILVQGERDGDLMRWKEARLELVLWILCMGRTVVSHEWEEVVFERLLGGSCWEETERKLRGCNWLPLRMEIVWMESEAAEGVKRSGRPAVVPCVGFTA